MKVVIQLERRSTYKEGAAARREASSERCQAESELQRAVWRVVQAHLQQNAWKDQAYRA